MNFLEKYDFDRIALLQLHNTEQNDLSQDCSGRERWLRIFNFLGDTPRPRAALLMSLENTVP